jgi:hypothetical protein
MCLPSHIVCSQTWLNHLINDHNLCYIANLKTIAQPFMHVHVFVLYFFIIFMNIQRIFGHDNFVPWQFEYMCLSCLDMLLVLTPMLGGYHFFGPNIYIYNLSNKDMTFLFILKFEYPSQIPNFHI